MSTATSPRLAADWPALSIALDGQAMRVRLGELLQDPAARIDDCEIERIKLRPPDRCSVLYRLTIRDARCEALIEQRVSARLWRSGEATRRAAQVEPARCVASAAGPAVCLLPSLGMLTWWWPNDPRLSAPCVFEDAARMQREILPQVIEHLQEGAGRLTSSRAVLMQYVPEQRLTMRVDLGWRAADGGAHETRVFAKAMPGPHAGHAHAILKALQESDAWKAGRLRTPVAILLQEAHGLSWQGGLRGSTLGSDPSGLTAQRAVSLGRQLAALHAMKLPESVKLPAFDPIAASERLDAALCVLGIASPGNRDRIERLEKALRSGLDRVAREPTSTLHGDLHAHNVLVDGERVGLIDLDTVCSGPAVIELGGWVADAIGTAVLAAGDPMRARATSMGVLAACRAAGGETRSDALLNWSIAWNLVVKRAWRAVVNLRPGRLESMPRLLEIAERIAGEGTGPRLA